MRVSLTRALSSNGAGQGSEQALSGAPILVALCRTGEGTTGAGAAWMAAAQMALAADQEGLEALVVRPRDGVSFDRVSALKGRGVVVAVLAIGHPAPRVGEETPLLPGSVPTYLAAEPPPVATVAVADERRFLTTFMEIASASAASEDLDGVLEKIARALGRLFPVDGASLGLREDGVVVIREILSRGRAVKREPHRMTDDDTHLIGRVIVSGRPLWRNDVAAEMRFSENRRREGLLSDMTIPLAARGRIFGAFRVACRRRHAYDPGDFEVLQQCADLTAVAVETQRLLLATKKLSETDGLTGVANHRHFIELLGQEVERAVDSGRPVSLLMLDIDDFKRFNDMHGHQTGDEVLRHVAQMVVKLLRRSDTAARYGGEEFAVLLPEAGPEEGLQIGEMIRAEVWSRSLRLPVAPFPLKVSVSVGVATLPDDAATPSGLVEVADRGLYRAKRSGKNRVCHALRGDGVA